MTWLANAFPVRSTVACPASLSLLKTELSVRPAARFCPSFLLKRRKQLPQGGLGKKHSTFRRTQKASGSGKSSLSCFKCCRNSHDGFRERTPFRWMVFPPVQRPTQKELVVTFQSLAIPLEVY